MARTSSRRLRPVSDHWRVCVWLLALASLTACSDNAERAPVAPGAVPSPPVSPQSPTVPVSGTIWVHGEDGVSPYREGRYTGWLEAAGSGHTTGWLVADRDGRYSISGPPGTRIRIMGGVFQPCAVTVTLGPASVVKDVHVVTDTTKLGSRLPAVLAAQTPTIIGTVYEVTTQGRTPLRDVRVETDGLFGMGLPTAHTLTDEEGRFVLCGQDGDASTFLYASKPGYALLEVGMVPVDGAPLAIELRR